MEDIFYNYRIIVSAVIIFIGLFLCFLGKKSVKVDFGSAVDCSLTCSSAAS